jgi:hypothetical protein
MTACRKKYGSGFPKSFASKLLGHKEMQGSLRTVAVLLVVTMAAALAGGQAFAFPEAQAVLLHPVHLHPAGCHSSKPLTPASTLPTSYQCCANGHHAAIPNASFTVRSTAAQLCSLASVDEPRLNFACFLNSGKLLTPANSPSGGAPLRI